MASELFCLHNLSAADLKKETWTESKPSASMSPGVGVMCEFFNVIISIISFIYVEFLSVIDKSQTYL